MKSNFLLFEIDFNVVEKGNVAGLTGAKVRGEVSGSEKAALRTTKHAKDRELRNACTSSSNTKGLPEAPAVTSRRRDALDCSRRRYCN